MITVLLNFFLFRFRIAILTTLLQVSEQDLIDFVLHFFQAFPIGSPIVHDIWQAFMLPSVQEEMARIDRKWFGDTQTCEGKSSGVDSSSSSLGFSSFSGLFFISGITSGLALLVHLGILAYQKHDELRAAVAGIIRAASQRMCLLLRRLRSEPEVDVLHGGDTVSL